MSSFYFLAPFLPPVQIGLKNPIARHELEELLIHHLSEKDFKQLKLLSLRRDLEALRHTNDIGYEADFIQEWLDRYETKDQRLCHFHELIEAFYHFVEKEGSPFIKAYFSDERDIGEKFLSLRKKEKAQDSPEFFVKLYQKGPLAIARGIVQYRFDKIDERLGLNVFSIDAILAYAAKYFLNEDVLKWDQEKGFTLLDKLEKGTL